MRLIAPLLSLAALLAVTGALIVPASARADADPASDTLLIAPVFYPYNPEVSEPLQTRLNGLTGQIAKAGLGVRIAIIESPTDLGAVPSLFGHPQTYAAFLDREISVEGKPGQPLLVVMPDGYGQASLPAAAAAAVQALPVPEVGGANPSNELAVDATTGLAKLAAAAGITLHVTALAGGGSGGGLALVAAAAGLVILVVSLVLLLRKRVPRTSTTLGGDQGAPATQI